MNGALKPKPYPDYRRSGVKWFDRLPTHWEVRRLRNVADLRVSSVDKHKREDEEHVRLCNYVDVYNNDRITAKMNFLHATATPDEIERFRLERSDVLITKDSETWDDIGVPALVSDSAPDLISGYHLALLRPRSECVVGGYLHRALESKGVSRQFHVHARGVTRYGLTHVGIKSVWLPVPPLPEQEAIVRFLDHADRRIQSYIRAKQKLIALLEEHKQVIIHQAVTGQIDVRTGQPYPEYRTSRNECLGSIPKHWKLARLKDVAQVQPGLTLGKDYSSTETISRPYLRVANVQDGRIDLSHVKSVQVPVHEARATTLLDGDVLMTEGGDIDKLGRGGIWRDEIQGCLHQNHIFAVRCCQESLKPEFLVGLMASSYGRSYFQSTAKRTTNLASTNSNTLRAFPIPLPSVDEQGVILRFLSRDTGFVDEAIGRTERLIHGVREYRARLINDVVTGRADVHATLASRPDRTPVEEFEFE